MTLEDFVTNYLPVEQKNLARSLFACPSIKKNQSLADWQQCWKRVLNQPAR